MEHESYLVRQVALLTMEMTRAHYSLTGASGYPKICQMLRVRRGYLEGELQKIEDGLNEKGELI